MLHMAFLKGSILGPLFDEDIKEMVKQDEKFLVSEKKGNSDGTSVSATEPSIGFKLTIDNVDYTQNVHYMTEQHQNKDIHYVSINRDSANHLDDKSPTGGINQMENGKCIPNLTEQMVQRENYITLVQRVIVENVPCLDFGKYLVQKHIPHKYSKEASQPTKSVSITNYRAFRGFILTMSGSFQVVSKNPYTECMTPNPKLLRLCLS